MLILNGIFCLCGEVTSDWAGDNAHETPGSWLEMQNLRYHPRSIESETEFLKIPSGLYVH